jgi:tetratricopeptide (TPR) repeat protein
MGKSQLKDMRICLNMIVKDEAHIIEQTLTHLKKYLSYWVISDTGSTDNTKEIIQDFFKKHKIPGQLVEHKWEDFGTNRSLALAACVPHTKHFDYIWVFDADDLVVGDLKFPKIHIKSNKNPDFFSVKFGSGFTYMRNQVFKATEKWRYVGVLHEYPDCITKKQTKGANIEGNYYIDSRRLGARSKISQEEKYLKDAAVLEKGLLKEPNNVRYMFYLAQSYMDAGKYEKAIEWYKKRVAAGQWFEEVYYSKYRIATCSQKLNKPWPEVEKLFLEAWKYLPSRCEPLFEIARYYRFQGNYDKGYKYAKLGSTIPFPKDQLLFLFKCVYDWEIWNELMICSYSLGKFEECLQICEKLSNENSIPSEDQERIKKLIAICSVNLEREEKLEEVTDENIIINKIANFRYAGRHETVMKLSLELLKRYSLNLDTENFNTLPIHLKEKFLQLFHSISISSYYTSYKKFMLNICEKILYTRCRNEVIDENNRNILNANRRFVLPLLNDLIHMKNVKIEFESPEIPGTNKRFNTLNPSICNFNDKYYCNIRCVNSQNDRCINYTAIDGSYNNKIVTRNFLLELDKDFKVVSKKELIDKSGLIMVRDSVQGFEDVNIFKVGNDLHFFCCTYFTRNDGVDAIHGIIAIDSLKNTENQEEKESIEITDAKIIEYEEKKNCEKNWLGFEKEGKLHYLYSQEPLILLKGENGIKCKEIMNKKQRIDCGLQRNSGGPLPFEDGYLVISHEVIWNGNGRTYCHKFSKYDKDFNLLQVSLPFKFANVNVEYCRSMTYSLDQKYILLGVGLEDKEFKIFSIFPNEISSLLFVPEPYY